MDQVRGCVSRGAAGFGVELTRPFFASMRSDLTVTAYDEAGFAAYVHGSAEVVGLMCLQVFLDADRRPVGVLLWKVEDAVDAALCHK